MQKKREPWVDIAKGLLILGVVYYHMNTILPDSCHIDHPVFEKLYNAHISYTVFFMPAFFVLTGYCSNFSRSFKEFLFANAKGILVPMVVLNVIPCLLSFNVEALHYLVDWRNWLFGLSFWFLPSLFLTKLLFWGIVHSTDNVWCAFCIAAICFVTAFLVSHFDVGVNYWYWKSSLAFVLFMQVGHFLRCCSSFALVCTVGACIYLVTFPIWYWLYGLHWPIIGFDVHCKWSEVVPYLIASMSGCLLVMRIATRISTQPVLEYVGKASLVIYCSHWFIAQHLSNYFSWVIMPDSTGRAVLFYLVSVGMAVVAGCFYYRVLNTRYLKWMIGK